MNKQRSPNYPQISLPDAIERIRTVYNAVHTARVPQDQVLSILGYNTRSGTSGGVLSGLRKYGLLEGSGDALRVTHDAVTILERQADHPERIAALNRAAFAPALFSEIREHFNGRRPSDEDLRIYLVTRGFSRTATDGVIRTYRETMQLAVADANGYTADVSESEEGDIVHTQQNQPMTPQQHALFAAKAPDEHSKLTDADKKTFSGSAKEFSFPLSFQRNVNAIVTIHGDNLKKRDLEVLKKKVTDLIDAWEDEEESNLEH